MPTDREIAEELADSIAAGSWTVESLEAIVTAARTGGARAMRERAAKWHDTQAAETLGVVIRCVHHNSASAIRALTETSE